MRRCFPVALLLAACASQDAGVLHQAIPGGPGDPIEVRMGNPNGGRSGSVFGIQQPGGQELPLVIEISNNSDGDVVIEQVSVAQNATDSPFQLDPLFRRVKELIEPGKEKIFDLPARGRQLRLPREGERNVVEVRVVVELQSGDSYYYEFEVPIALTSR
ncbi:MAG TPA: hypothetical protein VGR02_14815 [Thermoanaerobaculia bacterium]|jgi:hypothetical protein|nr:hypothetical protein [Thermoanaerobaculia bacterium]